MHYDMGDQEVNNKILEYIINLLISLDPIIQVLLIIFIVPLLFVGYKLVSNKDFRIDFFNLLGAFKKETIYKVQNHEIFMIKSIYSNYIQNIKFNNTIKNVIFRIILTEKVNQVYTHLKNFLKQDLRKIEDIDLKMLNLIDEIIYSYEKTIKEKLITKYKEDADYLYTKIYEDNFKIYHSSNITYILKAVQMFSKSRLTNNQKVYIFFNFINIALDQSILDSEKLFDELNGDLDKYNEKWHK